ncbi:MAG: nuclear transport factor 2 family protein [Pseudomonadota bacterium]
MRKRITLAMILAMLALAWAAPALAAGKDQALGQKLVGEFWHLLKAADSAKLAKKLSPAFQALHADGARDRKEYLDFAAKLKMGDYVLSDYKVTRHGAVLMVSYRAAVAEDIAGQRLPAGQSAPRLTGFVRSKSGWMAICHVNMRPLAK